MIDQRTRDIAQRLLDAELRRREQSLARQASNVMERMSSRGMLMSSVTVTQITDLTCLELRTRAHVAWDTFQRVLSDTGVSLSQGLAVELKTWLESFIEVAFQSLAKHLDHSVNGLGVGWTITPLQDEAAALKREFGARADLLVAALEKRAPSAAASAPTVMHFYGTVGAVQTGAVSSAAVSQHIGTADLAALTMAVERLADEIGAAADLEADARAELQEVLADIREELTKQKPNSIRLRQLAMGAATAIQTTASLRPAYEALRTALAPLGILLP